jgi:hypothetical protein
VILPLETLFYGQLEIVKIGESLLRVEFDDTEVFLRLLNDADFGCSCSMLRPISAWSSVYYVTKFLTRVHLPC